MDVVQRVRDLSNMVFDERGDKNERIQAAVAALRLVDRYLLGKKKIDVAADIIEKITNPLFAGVVADRAEQIADSVDRVLGSVDRVLGSGKKMSDRLSHGVGDGSSRGRKRRYSGGSR
jgi:hypothetical protein